MIYNHMQKSFKKQLGKNVNINILCMQFSDLPV